MGWPAKSQVLPVRIRHGLLHSAHKRVLTLEPLILSDIKRSYPFGDGNPRDDVAVRPARARWIPDPTGIPGYQGSTPART